MFINKLLIFILFIGAVSASPNTVFIGNSIIAGTQDTPNPDTTTFTIEYYWQMMTGKSYLNQGINGDTTTSTKNRFITDVVDYSPQNVIIGGAIVDISHDGWGTDTQILDNYEQMIIMSENANIKPYIMLTLPYSKGNLSMAQRIDELNYNISLKTLTHPTLEIINATCAVSSFKLGGTAGNCWNVSTAYSADGVHYNYIGNAILSQEVYKVTGTSLVYPTIHQRG